MEEVLRSIRAYLYEKSVSPLAGAFALAWVILNFRVIVVLLSGDSYITKFNYIDEYFYSSVSENREWVNVLWGRVLYGFVCPAALALTYIFAYPFAAAPVYEFALRRRQKLREIKQSAENARLLTVKESREVLKRLSDMEELYNKETARYQQQIAALRQTNRELEVQIENAPILDDEIDDGHSDEADAEEYDNFIDRQVAVQGDSQFRLSDLFGEEQWRAIALSERQKLHRRFMKRVERGDFVDVHFSGKTSGNEATYQKVRIQEVDESPSLKTKDRQLSEHEILTLQYAAGLKDNHGITSKDLSAALRLHIDEARLVLSDLSSKSMLVNIGKTDEDETLYSLKTDGRRYLVDNGLLRYEDKESADSASNLTADEHNDFLNTIVKNRFNESDFELVEDVSSDSPAETVGTVTITFKPSGISRNYKTGHGSNWPYMFEQDLVRGKFVS